MLQVSDDLLKYFKNFCSSPSVIMLFVYMKCHFSLSYRELEEMMIKEAQVWIILRCNGGFDALKG